MEVIKGLLDEYIKINKQNQMKKSSLYKKNLYKALFLCNTKKILFYGIKYVNTTPLNAETKSELINAIALIENVCKQITYEEMINVFPIEKNIDKYKDTMRFLEQINKKSYIQMDINVLLKNYNNQDICSYRKNRFKILNEHFRSMNKKSLTEDLCSICNLKFQSEKKKNKRLFKVLNKIENT